MSTVGALSVKVSEFGAFNGYNFKNFPLEHYLRWPCGAASGIKILYKNTL
jgi:hypothetical protein